MFLFLHRGDHNAVERNQFIISQRHNLSAGRRGGLVVERRTTKREVGGSIFTQVAVLCPWARYIYLPKVIPRKRWLRPDMTEKLFTGTLSKNKTKRKVLNLSSRRRLWSIGHTPIQSLFNVLLKTFDFPHAASKVSVDLSVRWVL